MKSKRQFFEEQTMRIRQNVRELAKKGLGVDDMALMLNVPRERIVSFAKVNEGWPSWWLA